ncbi:MAG: hypothetical protein ACOYL3_25215 [Desulfuromonadaceae bacterium]
MNATIIHKANIKSGVLDAFATGLQSIISDTLEVAGGKVAILKPEQVLLEFSQASLRDVGPDIRIIIFARSNSTRTTHENALARSILEKVVALIANFDEEHSVDVRLYLMDIGAAEHSLGK